MGNGLWRVRLSPADALVLALCALFTCLAILFHTRVTGWAAITAVNSVTATVVFVLASERLCRASRVVTVVHDWYVAPLFYLPYRESCYLVNAIRSGQRFDALLIAADRWLFGTDPVRWMDRFANPALTEVLQIAYTSFYPLFLVVGYELYRRRDRAAFHNFVFVCLYGFALSYLGYFIAPAGGPRFTLYSFAATESELPGLWLTHGLRTFVNGGEAIGPGGETSAASAACDVFPSGHTMMTLVVIWYAWKHRLRLRPFVSVLGSLLICATLYLRYHYAVDLLAGALFAIMAILTWQAVHGLIERLIRTRTCGAYDQN
jgi:membrane-associated phospholipid phosphatase